MNKSIKILLAIVILAGIAYYLTTRKPWNNLKTERKDFSIKDTAAIDKIFLANKKGEKVLLQKTENGWMINGADKADLGKINLIKSTIHDIEVRNPITDKEFNTVIANLASNATKVEFYNGEDLVKTLFVGEATPEGTGTYMMVDGSSTPFITHIPGFIGYLTPRFLTNPIKWKDKLVFNYSADIISTISVDYPSDPSNSFLINNAGSSPAISTNNGKGIPPTDTHFTKFYLASFSNLYIEAYDDDITQAQTDSILKQKPFCIIQVNTKNNTHKKLTVYYKGIDERTKERYDENGMDLTYDHDKYFAVVDDEATIAYIQDYNFGRIFKKLSDFTKK